VRRAYEAFSMSNDLIGARVAILVAHGFEQCELEQPRAALRQAGAATWIVSPEIDEVKGWDEVAFGSCFEVNVPLTRARPQEFDALLLPGGVLNLPRLRMLSSAIDFVRFFFETGKPIAAISHGPQLLIEVDAVRDRLVTSDPSIKKDLMNAGARWLNEPVVVDSGFVTSRGLPDVAWFGRKTVEVFSKEAQTGLAV
jgi:protease I